MAEVQESDLAADINLASSLVDAILTSCSNDFDRLKKMIKQGTALWYQQEDGGLSALHAACIIQDSRLVQLLIEHGAIWNCVDDVGNTPGDIALSLNDAESYRIVRDAGLRSEFLLHVLSSSPPLAGVLRNVDNSSFGSTETFLKSKLVYSTDITGQEVCSVMSEEGWTVGVMMGWERGIMKETVHKLCDDHPSFSFGLRVLNIGFGLGMIDNMFQNLSTPPSVHAIVEPHKDVLAHMRETGWYDRPGVKILEGCWQELLTGSEIYEDGGWDVVYIDTFAEGYEELKNFFDVLPDLLRGPDSRFSFFNGLGATNALFYDVYTQLSELHLKDDGINIEWFDVDTESQDEWNSNRWGDTKSYFKSRLYRLPVGRMSGL